jgi:hypothetical protein
MLLIVMRNEGDFLIMFHCDLFMNHADYPLLSDRHSRSNPLTIWRDTPNAFAKVDTVRP